LTLPERLIAIHRGLNRRRIGHAFGGAIALAYWTLNPRGTSDIDVNVFLPPKEAGRGLSALPDGVEISDGTAAEAAREGQVRVWWDQTPIDLFFDYVPIHEAAAKHRRTVAFESTTIPILGPIELAAFKVMFDRTRDWADIEEMSRAGTLDADALRKVLAEMLDVDDARFVRLDEAVRRGATE